MTSVPERPPIDRTKPPYKDDPVIAFLTDEQVWALARVMARMAISYAQQLEADGVTVEDLRARYPKPTDEEEHARLVEIRAALRTAVERGDIILEDDDQSVRVRAALGLTAEATS